VPRPTQLLVKKRRKVEPAERKQMLLEAGLAVFATQGFEAAKLDDVAAKAGVAKGTIYLHFRDKEDLFEQIVRSAVAPVLGRLQAMSAMPDVPTTVLLGKIFEMFRTEILETDRKFIIRLVLTEGARFPKIAAFYHREVIAKGMALVRLVVQRGAARGEAVSPDLERFPHLVFAPMLVAVMWEGLFSKLEPLDVEGMFAAHSKILTA
jgi:AcrR family transcriptional regulator